MEKADVYLTIEQHYRDNYERLVKKYSRYANGWHNAEDLVQDAYTRALQYWSSLNAVGNFNRWFSQILTNALKDKIGEERTRGAVDGSEVVAEVPARAFNRLVLQDIIKMVDREPEHIRTILTLHFFNQYKAVEIAQVLPESYSGIRVIIHNFRKKLREDFGTRVYE